MGNVDAVHYNIKSKSSALPLADRKRFLRTSRKKHCQRNLNKFRRNREKLVCEKYDRFWKPGDRLVEVFTEDTDIPERLQCECQINIPKCDLNITKTKESSPNANYNDMTKFNWMGIKSFRPSQETFLPKQTGPTKKFECGYDAFRAIWTDDILDVIVKETNMYAKQIYHEKEQDRPTFYPTIKDEILVLFAFYMMLGIVKYPTIDSVYSKSYLFSNSFFSRIMSRDRYFALNRYLSFVNNLTVDKNNPLYKIQTIIDHTNNTFQNLYIPKKNVTIDESLTLWKGLLNFKQYIPSKAARLGIKTFELCCSKTSYLWSFFVYTGRKNTDEDNEFPGCSTVDQTILRLIRPLLGKGYTLWMDNWFNSPLMARYLKINQTDCVGTLRANRLHVPRTIKLLPLAEGHYITRHCGDVSLMAWQDKRRVIMISTYHDDEQIAAPSRRQRIIYKPKVVRDYNIMMGAVDKKDQMLEPYKVERKKCKKWYFKLFKRILNVSILNSRILVEESINKKVDHLNFRLDLVDSIIKRHLNRSASLNVRLSANLTRYQYQLGHFVDVMHSDQDDAINNHDRPRRRKLVKADGSEIPSKKLLRKRCVQCLSLDSKSNIRVSTYCTVCKVPLCVSGCFKRYHTPDTCTNALA